jgi:sigma-B regulation protein RsbU (phosphoserine phosphatase)
VGVLYADSRVSATGFARPDLDLFAALAAQCALALERAERQRMEREQREARDVQRAMLPARSVVGDSVEVAGFCRPREEAGGDYFDLIPLGGDRLAVVLADASGHGLAAALCMSAARSLLRTFLPRTDALHAVLADVNSALARDMPSGTFMSLFLGELDLRSGGLRYASAGHNAAVVSRAAGACEELAPTGPALAVVSQASFGTAVAAPLAPDDLLLLYTDGIPEARGPQRELFGMRRLKRTLLACRESSAPEIVGTISRAIASFTGAAGPADDVSLVVAKGRAA